MQNVCTTNLSVSSSHCIIANINYFATGVLGVFEIKTYDDFKNAMRIAAESYKRNMIDMTYTAPYQDLVSLVTLSTPVFKEVQKDRYVLLSGIFIINDKMMYPSAEIVWSEKGGSYTLIENNNNSIQTVNVMAAYLTDACFDTYNSTPLDEIDPIVLDAIGIDFDVSSLSYAYPKPHQKGWGDDFDSVSMSQVKYVAVNVSENGEYKEGARNFIIDYNKYSSLKDGLYVPDYKDVYFDEFLIEFKGGSRYGIIIKEISIPNSPELNQEAANKDADIFYVDTNSVVWDPVPLETFKSLNMNENDVLQSLLHIAEKS